MEDMDHDKKKVPTKRREDLVPEHVILNGEEVEAFNITDAATYLGMSRDNLQKKIKERRSTGNPIPTFQRVEGGKETFVLKSYLDRMRTIVPTEP